jgi:hypothetical protein
LLFAYFVDTQKPLSFKKGMKQLVRRTGTTCVGYVELDFQRETGPREGLAEQAEDYRTRIEHLQRLVKEAQEGEVEELDAEMRELELSLQALAAEPEIVVNEGLVFDYPRSTKVIPDKKTKGLVGFIGADHVTIEYDYTVEKVEEMFGCDLKKNYTPYKAPNDADATTDANTVGHDWETEKTEDRSASTDYVRVWKHYDKPSGLVYFVADGYPKFLKEPAPPNVFVEQFWPLYVLTFNESESEDELFPPSDVALANPMQMELNRSRQGKREHRNAARPRWGYATGSLNEDTAKRLETARPLEAVQLDLAPGAKLQDVLQPIPVPGVDPNLYDTGEIMSDLQVVVGTNEALMGGLAKATATESSISASASATTDGSSVDDLDELLTMIARDAGAILLREMSEEQVIKIVGPGAVWPHLTLAEIADEVFLEVEAGSTGRPNQAVEMNNWKTMLPFLLQMGSIKPEWLARESLRRLDDRMDLTDAVVAGLPAIVAMNRMSQPAPEDPGAAPEAQGAEGADKTPEPQGKPTGSDAAFGSNQV